MTIEAAAERARSCWNGLADEFNQWSSLSEGEKIVLILNQMDGGDRG